MLYPENPFVLADDAVCCEPLSVIRFSLLGREDTGNIRNFARSEYPR